MLIQLDSDIRTAEAQWESEQNSYELEMSKLKDVETQIANCTIYAPQVGQVVYANEQSSRSSGEFVVEPGAVVRERQVIIRLPDPEFMQVDAKINESRVTIVSTGMPVKIRLDAFPDIDLRGEVSKVNEYPEASSWFSSQVKKYGTIITITNPPRDLRAGLTAEVRIQVDHQKAALQVPVQAVHEHGGKLYCLVQKNSLWSAHEVHLKASNDKFAVVSDGVAVGDVVAMDPRPLLEYVKLPEIPANRSRTQPLVAESVDSDGPSDRPVESPKLEKAEPVKPAIADTTELPTEHEPNRSADSETAAGGAIQPSGTSLQKTALEDRAAKQPATPSESERSAAPSAGGGA